MEFTLCTLIILFQSMKSRVFDEKEKERKRNARILKKIKKYPV